jgi:murein DD-endopeptidase MepM/ murein hydrolase activator NlpD|nr:M23 family metallopeptidase [Kofleriaceae bacterium]
MRRLSLAVLASVLTTGTASAMPATGLLIHKNPDIAALPSLAMARIGAMFGSRESEVIPPEVVDQLVHAEAVARDVVRGALDSLVALAAADDTPTADLTVLTTSPLSTMSTNESSGFGWRDDPYHHDTRYHSGADFRSKPGTPVLAAGDGVVVFAGWQGGYGNIVYVDHGGGVITRYAHMRRIIAKKDTVVVAGQELGEVGSTGRATGPHLHFEVRIDGHAVSPVLAMSIASLQRESPEQGRLAAFALQPEVQEHALAEVDRPRGAPPIKPQRPDRPGVKRQVKPLW